MKGFAMSPFARLDLVAVLPATESAADWPQFRGVNRDAQSAEKGLLQQWPAGGPKLAWQVSGMGVGYSSVSIQNGRLFTMGDIGADQFVIALSLDTKAIQWKTQIGPRGPKIRYAGPRGTPTADGAVVYAIGTEGDSHGHRSRHRQGALEEEPARRFRRHA